MSKYESFVPKNVYPSLVPRPLFSVFICGGGKKGLVDLRRTFCSTDSQILGVVNRCCQLQRPF